MQFQITSHGEEFNFEIEDVGDKFMWLLMDGDKIYMESSKGFASEHEAQKNAAEYVDRYFYEQSREYQREEEADFKERMAMYNARELN